MAFFLVVLITGYNVFLFSSISAWNCLLTPMLGYRESTLKIPLHVDGILSVEVNTAVEITIVAQMIYDKCLIAHKVSLANV